METKEEVLRFLRERDPEFFEIPFEGETYRIFYNGRNGFIFLLVDFSVENLYRGESKTRMVALYVIREPADNITIKESFRFEDTPTSDAMDDMIRHIKSAQPQIKELF